MMREVAFGNARTTSVEDGSSILVNSPNAVDANAQSTVAKSASDNPGRCIGVFPPAVICVTFMLTVNRHWCHTPTPT